MHNNGLCMMLSWTKYKWPVLAPWMVTMCSLLMAWGVLGRHSHMVACWLGCGRSLMALRSLSLLLALQRCYYQVGVPLTPGSRSLCRTWTRTLFALSASSLLRQVSSGRQT
ncbi:hypothetical protein COO60DRAFT_1475789 [Scenedesmus sp. NREL 46B-D3]|nr:hypothetical protein COO60DRAFT_1475789 [Scenedesmus sp. NREL 46B-D3]